MRSREPQDEVPVRSHQTMKDLFDLDAISQEEYNDKKRTIVKAFIIVNILIVRKKILKPSFHYTNISIRTK